MRLLKSTGWIFVSILLSFLFYSAVQWLSHDILSLLLILNSILLFAVFIIHGLLIKSPYTLTGPIILSLTIVIMLSFDNAFYFEHGIVILLIITGSLTGMFLRKKQYKIASVLSAASIVFLSWLGTFYFTRIETIVPEGLNISSMNKNSSFLTSHNGRHPVFSTDTVYLVNFSLVNCLPCRIKTAQLKKIAAHFADKPFRIVEIHTSESAGTFRDSYCSSHAAAYHDSLNTISKIYKINGGPEELIFDKRGKAVRKFKGFSKDQNSTYYSSTIHYINNLLNEQ